jgi:hypothetical protein
MLRLDLWANGLIALSFSIVAGCIAWLWWSRRRNWPQTWILTALFFCFICCALARLGHATYLYHRNPALIVILDWFAGVVGFLGAIFLPGGVRAVHRLPTPQEYQASIQQLARMELVSERLKWKEEREKELTAALLRSQRRQQTLAAILAGTSIPDGTKDEITALIEDTK